MNRHLFSSISFKNRASFSLLAVLLSGCTASSLDGGSSSLSSLSPACAGDGGLIPMPVAPQAIHELEKFGIPERLFQKANGIARTKIDLSLPANTPLLAIVNETCVVTQPVGSRLLSQKLRSEIEAQPSLSSHRSYPLRVSETYTYEEIEHLVHEDPCLLNLSEDSQVTVSATVNDPQFPQQLHLSAIGAETAWDTFHTGLTGEVVIAIIDDGIQLTHPDLSGRIWTNPGETAGNGVDDDGNGYVDDVNGYNFATNIASPAHENGSTHGTHVAGLAAAQGDNGIGITGVMGRNVRIMVLNVFGASASAGSSAIVNALNYARLKGAKVINMSLGGKGTSSAVNTAMINAVAAGAFIAVAAGNNNDLVTAANFYQPMGYAKDLSGAISVGSIDATTSLKSSFSNYSTTYVEIAAPGSNAATGGVLSTYPTNAYTYLQGTSMSSPIVAGSAALLIGWVQSKGQTITPAQVESLLRSSADSSASLSPYFLAGASLNLSNLASSAVCNY